MTIRLIIAPPAGGKTTYCLNQIKKLREHDPLALIQVIVPDSLQTAGWKRCLAYPAGTIGTHVSTFQQVALSLMESFHDKRLLIPHPLNSLCIQEAVNRAEAEAPLEHFAAIKTMPGFISELGLAFSQMQRALVSPEDFTHESDSPKLHDVSRIYQAYLDILNHKNWISSAGLLGEAARLIQNNPEIVPSNPLFIVDGFDEFEKDQLQLMKFISQRIDETIITLPGELNGNRFVYRKFSASAKKICSELHPEVIELNGGAHLPTVVRHFAEQVFLPAPTPYSDKIASGKASSLQMLEASSQTDEVRETLRWIKQRVLKDGIRCGNCAIFVPDLSAYQPIIRMIGAEMGIPLYFASRLPLTDSPVTVTLKMLFQLSADGFTTISLLSVLRSPFFDFGFSSVDLLHLVTISQKMSIVSGIDQWQEAFEYLIKNKERKESYIDEDGDRISNIQGIPAEAELPDLYRKLMDLFGLLTPSNQKQSRKKWAEWILSVLNTLKFFEHLSDSEKEIEHALNSCLEQIVLYEDLLKQDAVDYMQFLNAYFSAIDNQILENGSNAGSHSVFVGDITWARGERFDAVALTGFSEKLFPKAVREEFILTDELRGKLGMTTENDQSSLMIQAVTRADCYLLITRPWLTDNGDEWQPSIYWTALCQTVNDSFVSQIRTGEKSRPFSQAASERELLFWMSLRGCEKLPAELENLSSQLELDRAAQIRLHSELEGQYPGNNCVRLSRKLNIPDKPELFSVTQIETYLFCPFDYFIRYRIGLEQISEPQLGMDVSQLGSLMHRILELTFCDAPDASDFDAISKKADGICDRLFEKAPLQYNFRPSRLWPYDKIWYRRIIQKTIQEICTSFSSGNWKVAGTEAKFGYGDKPALDMKLTDDVISLRGSIDRVDSDGKGNLRVVDYKYYGSHIDNTAVKSGRKIQAGVYAIAAVEALKLGQYCSASYWKIRKNESVDAGTYEEGTEAPPEKVFLQKFADGMTSGNFPAAPMDEKCPDYCPAAQWCWKFNPER